MATAAVSTIDTSGNDVTALIDEYSSPLFSTINAFRDLYVAFYW